MRLTRLLTLVHIFCAAYIIIGVRPQSTFCMQGASEISDPCLFECFNGHMSDVSLELERLSHENNRCRHNGVVVILSASVLFTNNSISPGWFIGDIRLIELELDLANIERIASQAFNATAFGSMQRLTIRRLHIAADDLQPDTFAGLQELRELYFYQLQTFRFAPRWLASIGQTLRRLLVFGPPVPEHDLNGLTAGAELTTLRHIHYALNLNGHLDADTFSTLPSIETIELTGCAIETLGAGVFDGLGPQMRLLKLNQNRLRRLPVGVFDGLLRLNAGDLTIYLEDNPWDCRCELEHVQRVLRENADVFAGRVVCEQPSHIGGMLVESTQFCVDGREAVFDKHIECTLDENDEDGIAVAIAYPQERHRLMSTNNPLQYVWRMPGQQHSSTLIHLTPFGYATNATQCSNETTTDCQPSDMWSLQTRLPFKTPHMLCLLNRTLGRLSPLDCVSVWRPRPRRTKRLWLRMEEKPVLATVAAIILAACFGVGSLTVLVVRSALQRQKMSNKEGRTSVDSMPLYSEPDYEYAELCAIDATPMSAAHRIDGDGEVYYGHRSRRAMSTERASRASAPATPYLNALRRTASNPSLYLYQSRFDEVPPSRINSSVLMCRGDGDGGPSDKSGRISSIE